MIEYFLKAMNVIPAGRRSVIKREGNRYFINLPTNLSHVWKYLNEKSGVIHSSKEGEKGAHS